VAKVLALMDTPGNSGLALIASLQSTDAGAGRSLTSSLQVQYCSPFQLWMVIWR